MTLDLGDAVPAFDLTDQHGRTVRIGSGAGRPAWVVLFPGAFTGTCSAELPEIDALAPALDELGVGLVGAATDTRFALRVWADGLGARMPIVSDFWPHGRLSQAIGSFDASSGRAARRSVLIDAAGRVAAVVEPGLDGARAAGAHLAAARRLVTG